MSYLPRLQLFEFEDLSWFPDPIRRGMTDFLRFWQHVGDLYAQVEPLFERAVALGGGKRLVDLCAGGGGGLVRIAERLTRVYPDLEIILTDLYPNMRAFRLLQEASDGRIGYRQDSIDATAVPAELSGTRLILNAFHHFPPQLGKAILADAARQRQPILVCEILNRDAKHLLMMAGSPLGAMASAPFIRPFRWSRLAANWLLPVVPGFILWDGMVSAMRVYTPDEMKAMGEASNVAGYTWEAGREEGLLFGVSWLLGYPEPVAKTK